MSLDELKVFFKNPGREYGPTPFLALNSDLAPNRLVWSLEELARAGMAGVFLHPRTGLEIEYLSEKFFERIGIAIETCARLGLKAWLYDEYNWPSGPAAGKLLAGRPEFRQKYLDYLVLKKPRASKPVNLPGEFVAVFSLADGAERVEGDFKGKQIALPWMRGPALIFYQAECRDKMFANSCAGWIRPEPGYIDLMNPKAGAEFIRLTHEQYAARFFTHFGKTIPGIFTDEPQNYNGFPWSQAFCTRFLDEHGYDPVDQLYLLVVDRDNYINYRIQYYSLAGRMMDEGFYQPISRWCRERNLILTGHLGMEERITQIAVNHGGLHSHLSQMQMPGIDALNVGDGITGGLGNMEAPNFACKMASSISALHGHDRTLCEAGGGAGWQMRLSDFKQMSDWLFGLGINFLLPHQVLLSTKGLRKRDFPPSHFWQEPWWEYYGDFSNYVRRVSWLLSQGERLSEIAVLIPCSAFKALSRGRGHKTEELAQLSSQIEELTRVLVQCQREFDYLFEESAIEGGVSVEEGKICGAGREYKILVVPSVAVMEKSSLELIERFLEQGGMVFFLGPLPEYDEKGEDIRRWRERIIGQQGRVKIYPDPAFAPSALAESLARVAPGKLRLSPALSAGIVLQSRKIGDDEIYFLANLSSSHLRLECRLETGKKGLGLLFPGNGDFRRLPFASEKNGHKFSLDFAPQESLVIVASDEIPASWVEETSMVVTEFDDEKLSGFYPPQGASVKIAGKESELPVEEVPPSPIKLDGPFAFEPLASNSFRLGPWRVRAEQFQPLSLASLSEENFFSGRTRALIYGLRPLVRLLNIFLRPETKYQELVYENFGNIERDLGRFSKVLGIDFARLGLYQTIDLLFRFSEYLPLAADFRVYPPPGKFYQAETDFILESAEGRLELVFEDLGEPFLFRINGRELEGKPTQEKVWDDSNLVLEISRYVKRGRNQVSFTSRQPSFPCLYPSFHTIEPIVLRGDFEVRKKNILGRKEAAKPLKDLRELGYPHYRGRAKYSTELDIDQKYMGYHLLLEFSEIRDQIEVYVNGRSAGRRMGPPYQFLIGHLLEAGSNRLEFIVSNTAANLLAAPEPWGIMGSAVIWPFYKFSKTRQELMGGEKD